MILRHEDLRSNDHRADILGQTELLSKLRGEWLGEGLPGKPGLLGQERFGHIATAILAPEAAGPRRCSCRTEKRTAVRNARSVRALLTCDPQPTSRLLKREGEWLSMRVPAGDHNRKGALISPIAARAQGNTAEYRASSNWMVVDAEFKLTGECCDRFEVARPLATRRNPVSIEEALG